MFNPEEFYRSEIKKYSARLSELKKRSAYISTARLISFLLVAIGIYCAEKYGNGYWFLAVSIALFSFILLIRISASLSEKKKLVTKLLFINNNEEQILNGGANSFYNGALMEMEDNNIYATDLDIFGEKSVFHLLNRTATTHGGEKLIDLLNNSFILKEDIIQHQQAVQQFAKQPDTRQLITARGLLNENNKSSIYDIVDWIKSPEKVALNQWIGIARFVMPALNVIGILIYLNNNNLVLFGTAFVLNWLIIGIHAKYINQQHQLIGKKEAVIQQYGTILKAYTQTDSGDSHLLGTLKGTSLHAIKEIFSLSRLSSSFDQRLNLLVGFFLNGIFLYDIQVIIALEKWKKKNREEFSKWISAVGEIEKINSLATFYFNHPEYCFPEVLEGKPFIRALGIGHPLIPAGKQVTNDITAGVSEKLLLITGSNMSGKSTFLRTIGVNILLAQCGLPVCAKAFSFTPMQILSSIRISDSLQENTSYFMAELKRLKEIIDSVSNEIPSLVLIDEVLRGTNSDDKTYGSEELIKKLSQYNCLAFFATHDLTLSVLETTLPEKVKNYCFESTIIDDELLFDYKLRRGVATNKNASFLMKKMGIIG